MQVNSGKSHNFGNKFNIIAAFDDPPPKPAAIGIFFLMCIFANFKELLIVLIYYNFKSITKMNNQLDLQIYNQVEIDSLLNKQYPSN